MTELSGFQQEIARLFFSLQSSHGFVLAGGGALLASGLSNRPTQDLDFFGSPGQVSVSLALGQFLDAIQQQNWEYKLLGDTNDFARVRVIGSTELIVDLAIDVAPRFPVAQTPVGPVFSPLELAGEDAGKAKHLRQLSKRLRTVRNFDGLHSHRRSGLQVDSQVI